MAKIIIELDTTEDEEIVKLLQDLITLLEHEKDSK
tara:strand:- start:682 stop:786 length:105 start_codon:yes stop_codon:yes gene_type:complete